MPLEHGVDARGRSLAGRLNQARMVASALIRLAAILTALLVLLPLHLLSRGKAIHPGPIARLFVRTACRLLRLRFRIEGREIAASPVLFVSNHVSWGDIFVLGSAFPASFVAKADVARWPVLGWLIARHGTIFVDRTRRSEVGAQRDAIGARLQSGDSIFLFPEGTSSDGRQVLPFKSALFASAARSGARVQPVTIVWTLVGGRPIDETNRRRIAWIDDMLLLPHLWELLVIGGAEARIICHEPIAATGRRELAEFSRRQVAAGLSASPEARA
jgi:1-acyl-sn-glycerol-3-phosphate acyltransferase